MHNKDLAKRILGREVYFDLLAWIDDIRSYKADYTVFIVRRSFVLMQIFTDIWEQETGRKLDDFFYITDSAILTVCDQIAEFYERNSYFPSIILCDDILIHGRNINNLIYDVENRLKELLPNVDERLLIYELEKAIHISVYTCSKSGILLEKRYESSLRMYRKESYSFLHVLSSNISTLILNSEVANVSYLYSAFFDKDSFFSSIIDSVWVKTNYQNTEQYSLIIPVVNEYDDIQMIYSYCATIKEQGIELVPLVFLPQISNDETMEIYKNIIQRMEYKGYKQEYIDAVNKLYLIEGKRIFYELLSFIHSYALLNDFFEKNNIDYNKNYYISEIEKLSHNYYLGDLALTINFVKELVANPIIVDQSDLKKHINNCICYSTYMIKKKEYILLQSYEDEADTYIKQYLENLFFWQGMKEEIEAKKVLNSPSVRVVKNIKKTIYGCAYVISELVYATKNLNLTIAYFLQMMDAGVISISLNCNITGVVDGFCQIEKAGEQSLLVQPLRNMVYLPFLNLLCDFCEELHLDEKLILNEFCIRYGMELECKQIGLFLDILYNMGQRPKDWMGDYSLRIGEREFLELIEEKNKYLNLFRNFISKTSRNYLIEHGRVKDEKNKNR